MLPVSGILEKQNLEHKNSVQNVFKVSLKTFKRLITTESRPSEQIGRL